MLRQSAHSMGMAIYTGRAQYLKTGRPNAFGPTPLKKCFISFFFSSYLPALKLILLYALYRILNDNSFGYLPLALPLLAAADWLLLPVIYNAFPMRNLPSVPLLLRYIVDLSSEDTEHSFHALSLEQYVQPWQAKIWVLSMQLMASSVKGALLYFISYASILECSFYWLLACLWSICLGTFCHAAVDDPFINALFALLPISIVVLVPLQDAQFSVMGPEIIISGLVFMQISDIVKHAVHICIRLLGYCLGRGAEAAKAAKTREKCWLTLWHDMGMVYHTRLMAAVVVFIVQALTLFLLALVDSLIPLHTAVFFHSLRAVTGVFKPGAIEQQSGRRPACRVKLTKTP